MSKVRDASRRLLPCLVLGAALSAATATARADGLTVLTAGALKPVVSAVAANFQKDTGKVVTVENDTAGALLKRLDTNDNCDVVVLPPTALDALADKGVIERASIRPVARVGIGVAVAQDAPMPDVSSVGAFKHTVLAAPSVAYLDPAAGGSSGVYLAGLFKQLGIGEQVAAKAVLVPGGLVAERVVDGRAALAIHQISEIMAVPGAKLVGPLPPEIQSYTNYAVAMCAKSGSRQSAEAFIGKLRTPAAAAMFKLRGMEPVE